MKKNAFFVALYIVFACFVFVVFKEANLRMAKLDDWQKMKETQKECGQMAARKALSLAKRHMILPSWPCGIEDAEKFGELNYRVKMISDPVRGEDPRDVLADIRISLLFALAHGAGVSAADTDKALKAVGQNDDFQRVVRLEEKFLEFYKLSLSPEYASGHLRLKEIAEERLAIKSGLLGLIDDKQESRDLGQEQNMQPPEIFLPAKSDADNIFIQEKPSLAPPFKMSLPAPEKYLYPKDPV